MDFFEDCFKFNISAPRVTNHIELSDKSILWDKAPQRYNVFFILWRLGACLSYVREYHGDGDDGCIRRLFQFQYSCSSCDQQYRAE